MSLFQGEFILALPETRELTICTGSLAFSGVTDWLIEVFLDELQPLSGSANLAVTPERSLDNILFFDFGETLVLEKLGHISQTIEGAVAGWARLRIEFASGDVGRVVRGRFSIKGTNVPIPEPEPLLRLIDPCRAGFFFPASYLGKDACP